MSSFTPVAGLIGGALIGLSAVLLLGGIGRLAGISNIAHGALRAMLQGQTSDWAWRLVFLAGMVGSASLYFALTGAVVNPRAHAAPWLLVGGGLLVGYGTSLGNGCTSGHGVCGLGRLSVRSLAATLTFMATGALTVFVVRHLAHLN
jgi:uncharacterized membrane protein YedE/YeeE